MSAYSIYADNRPMRVAYLLENVPKKRIKLEGIIENIITGNQRYLGGRFSPILLLKGGVLDNKQLSFLKTYDPDSIMFIGKLSQKTLQAIDLSTSPYNLEEIPIGEEYTRTQTNDERIAFLPTPTFIARVNNMGIHDSTLVIFNIKDLKDNDVKKFIATNFGLVEEAYGTRKELESVSKYEVNVTDKQSLIDGLNSLDKIRNPVFPIQLSATHCSMPNTSQNNFSNDDVFEVCIGDSLRDIIYAWNLPLTKPYWKRNRINCLWIPSKLSENKKFIECLGPVLNRFSKSYTSWGSNHLRTVSFSVGERTLKKFSDSINVYFHTKQVEKYPAIQNFPDYGSFFTFDRLKNEMQYFRFNSDEENLILEPPLDRSSVENGGYWMTDLYINKGNQGLYYSNLETWLQLPPKNILTRSIFRSPSRITREGLPSCLARMPFSSPIAENGNVVKFKMIPNSGLFQSLILSNAQAFKNFTCYTDDARKDLKTKEYIRHDEISSGGKYLMGFVGNFGGLSSADQFLSEKYWIDIFEHLSGKNAEKDKNIVEALTNKIGNNLKRGRATVQDPEQLAHYVLDLAKNYDLPSTRGGSYEIFNQGIEERIKRYLDPTTSKKQREKMLLDSKEEAKEEMNDLIQLGILLMGFYLRCSSCGFAEWRSVEDAAQVLTCRGCTSELNLDAEHSWSYRLNSLVQAGIAKHGLVPVVRALANLSQRARHFFAFYPSVNVYAPGRKDPFTDIDLLCVVDGKFIIGECKQSSSGFGSKDYKNMITVGKALRPDEIFFCAFTGTQTEVMKKNLKDVETQLKPYGIKVKWMGNDYVSHLDERQ